MNQTTTAHSLGLFGCLIWLLFGGTAESQIVEEISVPEPTRLQTAALADNSELVRSEALGRIESDDARASVTAIEVRGHDERVRGLRIVLENATSSDQIYIPYDLLSNFRDELDHLEYTRRFDDGCQARFRCIHGIARCRPSQTEVQAYCPGRFSMPNGEQGFVLSTPRSFFLFPSVEVSQFKVLVGEALQLFE